MNNTEKQKESQTHLLIKQSSCNEVEMKDDIEELSASDAKIQEINEEKTDDNQELKPLKYNYVLGALYLTISTLSASVSVIFAKFAFAYNKNITAFDICLVRGVVLSLVFLAYSKIKKQSLVKFNGRPMLCICTSFVDSIAVILIIYSMKYISATKSSLIVQCNPIVTMIIGVLLFKEVINYAEKTTIPIMIVGLILISINKASIPGDINNPILGFCLAF